MRVKSWTDLILINLLVLIFVIAILAFPSNVTRIILGIPFVLFFPGYTFMAALFPRKGVIDGIQHVALSLGLSISVVPIIGLILNYTPWGITLEPVLGSVTAFILIMSVIAVVRRRRLPAEERVGIILHMSIPGWSGNVLDRVLKVLLVISVLGAMGAAGYVIATPKNGEIFTEFYILGTYGQARDYPQSINIGGEVEVTACIINRNTEAVGYRLVITLADEQISEVGPIALPAGDTWEQVISFTPDKLGENQKVAFFLYEQGETESFQTPLSFHIDVIE